MKNEKMIKTSKALERVFRILQCSIVICVAAGVFVLGIFTVMYATNRDAIMGAAFRSIDIGTLTLELTEEAAPSSRVTLLGTWLSMISAIAFVLTLHYALGVFRKILKPMTEGNPFAPCVSKEIRKLAFASLAVGVIRNGTEFVETLGAARIFDLNRLIQNSQIQAVTVNSQFDMTFVLAFFVLLLVSYIFRYGEELQKLSDETL